ncbi:MAG: FG-GAP-like repeat-containing protein [Bryobacteraceae bacterium]
MLKIFLSAICLVSINPLIVLAAPKSFKPDHVFESVSGMRTIGQASWQARQGEIVATPRNSSGGWLVLDRSYQDIEFYTEFKCAAKCDAGVLLRAEPTSDGGLKGVYVSLSDGDVDSYELTIGPDGKELSRKRLDRATAQFTRFATSAPANDEAKVPGFAKPAPTLAEEKEGPATPVPPAGAAPAGRAGRNGPPPPAVHDNEWNNFDVIVDMDMVWMNVNGRRGSNAETTDRMMSYGPIVLHAGGAGEVEFKDVSAKDLNPKTEPDEKTSSHFRTQRLNDFLYSWGAAAGDINHDGVLDVVAGPFYWLGPKYTESHEFTAARSYGPATFPDGLTNFTYDFNGDGWTDIISVYSRPIYLYVNPKGQSRRWERYNVVPNAIAEIEVMRDIDGDGRPEILFVGPGATMAYAKPDPANPTAVWKVHTVSEPGLANPHGMGVGDINGDGHMDIVNSRGWWEQPATGPGDGLWKYHPADFGSGGAEMGIYDVNGDGKNDVVTAIAAHGMGLAWFEQKRDAQGQIEFVRHQIMGDFSTKNAGDVTFSEPHAAAFADLDGDGIPDMVVGKRLYSHLESHIDPDPNGPAVLYWYRTVRNPKAEGGAEFVPELINNRSGVGSQFEIKDLNNDGAPDIIISDVKGTFIFWNQMHSGRNHRATE